MVCAVGLLPPLRLTFRAPPCRRVALRQPSAAQQCLAPITRFPPPTARRPPAAGTGHRFFTRGALGAEAQATLDGQLHGAVGDDDVAAIERLAAEGASPDAKDEGGTPAVVRAVDNGHAGAVSALARLGADLDAREPDYGMAALMGAAIMGKVECARALLAGGADRTLRATGDWDGGKTALNLAEEGSKEGCAEVAALLRE